MHNISIKPKLIIYDFDETLVSANIVYLLTFNMLLEHYNKPKQTQKYMDFIHSMSFEEVFSAWFGEKMLENIWKEYELYYSANSYNYCTPIKNSLEFVKKCNKYGIKQVIMTNKPDFIATPEIVRNGFHKYVNGIVGNDCGYNKEDEKRFNIILNKAGIIDIIDDIKTPENLWIFGNSKDDVSMALKYNSTLFFTGDDISIIQNFPQDKLFIFDDYNNIML